MDGAYSGARAFSQYVKAVLLKGVSVYDFVLVFGLLLWLIVGVYYIFSPVSSLFHPATFYLIVHGIVFAVRPILAHLYVYDGIYYAYQFYPSDLTKILALLVAHFGFLIFMFFVLKEGGIPLRFDTPLPGESKEDDVHVRRCFWVACLLCLPISIYSTAISISDRSSDGSTMMMDAATGYSVNTTSNGYLHDASLMLLPALVTLAWLYRFKWWSLLPLALAIGARAATGSRWPFVMAFFSLSLLYLYERRQRWVSGYVLLGAVPFVALFTVVGLDRGYAVREFFNIKQVEVDFSERQRFMESMDYGNMEFLEYLVEVIPEKTGTYNYFTGNLQILTEPIPRVLWVNKPVGSPIKLYSLFDYGYPIGMTYSVPGEGWAQLGWVGVAIWCALFGSAYGRIYCAFVRAQKTQVVVASYAVFMPLSIAAFRDGFLLTIVKTSVFSLAVLFVWALIIRLTRRYPGASV